MNKQPSSTMMTRLCWGVFFLVLLFLGFQVIPHALGQRNRDATKSAARPVAKDQSSVRVKPYVPTVPVTLPNLPYDVRVPAAARGGLPETNSGPARAHGVQIPPNPKYPQVVLYDQYNNAGANATSSQDFEPAFDAFDDELADDFVVPGGQSWSVESVDADGVYFNGPGPAPTFNVRFYTNGAGNLPGTLVETRLAQSYVQGGSTFSITLSPAVPLTAGTYWVSVQARMDFALGGQWGWTDRTVQSNDTAAWQNPGGGFGVCPTWTRKLTCVPTASGPDQVYRLNGTVGGGGTPTPTPSCTPDHYSISQIGGAIEPGTTDIGNHADDLVTTIAIPFSYTLYDQTFNAINVSSNGNAQFTTTDNFWVNVCLPWLDHDYMIFPYWDDQRTDVNPGCAGFPGGTCGIFTSVSGAPPNRIFNIEWRTVYFRDNTQSANYELRLYEGQTRFDVIYGTTAFGNADATAGVQKNNTAFDEYFCIGVGGAATGGQSYILQGCGPTPTPTVTPTCTPSGAGAIGPWTNAAPRAIDAYGAGAAGDGTNAYAGAGFSFSLGAYTDLFARFDPVANTWTPLAPVPSTGEEIEFVYSPLNNKVYAFGGIDNINVFIAYNLTRIYDIATGTWSAGAPMPLGRQQMGSGYWNGKIYLAGGYTDGFINTAQSIMHVYDVATDTWDTTRASMPEALGGPGGAAVNGKFYVMGGRDAVNTNRNIVYVYDIATNTWATGANIPTGVNVPGSAVIDGSIWIFGGGNPFAGPRTSPALGRKGVRAPDTTGITQIYDPVANSWSPGPPLNQIRSFPAGTNVGANIAVAVGGYTGVSSTASVEVNIGTGCPSPTPTPTPTCTPGGGGLLVGSGLTLGYPPNGYTLIADNTVDYTFANSQAAPNDFAIFETHDPWGGTVVKDAITANGHTFATFTPAQLAGFVFSDYRVVVLNWDDNFLSDFLAPYTAAIPALEAYVNGGGVVWVQGSFQGSPPEAFPMPFGGQANHDLQPIDWILDPASPMMTGVPNPIVGNFASHASMSGLPGNAHVVVTVLDPLGAPVIYDLGGGCPSPTPTPTPTVTPSCTPIVINGSITPGDPDMAGRMFRDGIASLCEAPKVCPGPFDAAPHDYDSYTFTNTTGSTQCVTVTVDAMTCVGNNFIFAQAYLGSFNPADLCANYLADIGGSPNPVGAFSFDVGAGQTFVVVINEVNSGAGCVGYSVTIDGICPGGTPTPTPTATATATATPTATPTATATATATATPTATPTATATATATATPPPTPTPTATPTATPVPTPSPLPRPTPGPSATPHGTPPRP